MLTNLLPGFRDLRAPLAAGYLWLATVWVWFAQNLPGSPSDATGFLKKVYELAGVAGRPAIGIALSFAAYLIGAMATEISNRLLRAPIRSIQRLGGYLGYRGGNIYKRLSIFRRPMESHPSFNPITDEVHELVLNELDSKYQDDPMFREQIYNHLSEAFFNDLKRRWGTELETVEDVKRMVDEESYYRELLITTLIDTLSHSFEITRDLRYVPERIIEKKQKIFERYDQLRSEGEFRTAVAVPLIFLIIALIRQTSLHIVFGLLFIFAAILLLLQGNGKYTAAQLQLAQAIRAEPADSPPLDRMSKGAIKWLNEPMGRIHRGLFGFYIVPSFGDFHSIIVDSDSSEAIDPE